MVGRAGSLFLYGLLTRDPGRVRAVVLAVAGSPRLLMLALVVARHVAARLPSTAFKKDYVEIPHWLYQGPR